MKSTYINRLLLDGDDNIYASIIFLDSLSINGHFYSQPKGYGTAIAKLSSAGDILWTHHYYSNDNLTNQVLRMVESCNSCPSTLLISGSMRGDSILVDGVLKAQHASKFYSQFFVATLTEHGDILQTKFLDEGIRSIADINFYQNRIYFAGAYTDTVNWNGTYATPQDQSSSYIGELNEQADLIGFVDLQSSSGLSLTGFKISPQYGFLLAGSFIGSFSLQSYSMSLAGQYYKGAFIASINDTLTLSDCKYIEGGYYNLRHISVFNDQISGTAVFEDSCNFQNQSCFAWNDDISTFQTRDIRQLTAFDPHPFPTSEIPLPFAVQVYPNPFGASFKMKFSEPIYSTSLTMTNAFGQICRDIEVSQINDTEVSIDATGLSAGIYMVQYLTCNNFKASHRLIKVYE
jgi:hypothetical protein